ncbi:hypothetical protein [Riemerella anatipestifer]|uniref:hypothetical protein n=1 Tax=Riemerella anatipestifer TaxID=34085 RepID=UPI0012B1905A|nr:hypothetical protein [Riemerella anatipestifer]MBT0549615.1 hypothetical protein [Riemerella anatipestifer]MBT0556525.1 hypothetical protein [Riemerella anatipestifer]MBT0560357.1 hypothetical protein [Riemerella anatipestifer]MCD5968799.1 hypothetical protein [Riemerella anatipestifer]MCU7571085.1 hypothetical protein [Riemerella anatipestifer]
MLKPRVRAEGIVGAPFLDREMFGQKKSDCPQTDGVDSALDIGSRHAIIQKEAKASSSYIFLDIINGLFNNPI